MARRIYIFCDFNERELPEIKLLCDFLRQSKFIVEFTPKDGADWNYQLIEEAIDRCNVFVAGIGLSASCSTWLAHEINYAFGLRRLRMRLRPRIFAIRLSNYSELTFVEKFSKNYPVEWLTETNYKLLLEDSPNRL